MKQNRKSQKEETSVNKNKILEGLESNGRELLRYSHKQANSYSDKPKLSTINLSSIKKENTGNNSRPNSDRKVMGGLLDKFTNNYSLSVIDENERLSSRQRSQNNSVKNSARKFDSQQPGNNKNST